MTVQESALYVLKREVQPRTLDAERLA